MPEMLSRVRAMITPAHLRVALAATTWGTWSLFLRPAAVDPRWSSAIMLAVVTIAAAPLLVRRSARGPTEGPPRRLGEWSAIVALGVFDAANAALFFAAMSVTNVAIAVLSHYLAPVFVAIVAPAVLGTARPRRALPLTLLALCGLALVLERALHGNTGRPVLGALLGSGSAVFYAANVLITKRVGPRFTAEEQLVYHAAISAVLLAVAAWVLRAPLPSAHGAGLVAFGSIFAGAFAGLLFLQGLKAIPAEHAGILTFLEPITAVVVAWLVYGERPGVAAAVGGAMVLTAGALAIAEGAPSTPE
jgi:drug/metabolite transporter, DME family